MDALAMIREMLSVSTIEQDIQRARRAEVERWGIVTSAEQLSRSIAAISNLTADEALSGLTHIPDACLPLLASSQGWTALALLVVTDLQATATGIVQPTVH